MQSSKFVEELKQKSLEQLNIDLVNQKKQLFELRLQNATNQLENTAKIRQTRIRCSNILGIKKYCSYSNSYNY